jgi:hypothetical protein
MLHVDVLVNAPCGEWPQHCALRASGCWGETLLSDIKSLGTALRRVEMPIGHMGRTFSRPTRD